jgi:predicted signal transduction protein with EAL and GGDEF domain
MYRRSASFVVTAIILVATVSSFGADSLPVTPATSGSLDAILQGLQLETIYETSFDQPLRMVREDALIDGKAIAREPSRGIDWVLEGAATVSVKGGRLHLKNESDHCVLWNTREFPESFVAEWDFQHHAPQGTAIIFFAAQANPGGSIFTPGMPMRGARFGNYTKGAINCYHVSYTATDEQGVPRGSTHLKKDGRQVDKRKLGGGLARIDGRTGRSFRVRLAKLRQRLILEIDGQISFDITDGDAGESASYSQGQIGFRQMRHCLECSYGHLKVDRVKFDAGK